MKNEACHLLEFPHVQNVLVGTNTMCMECSLQKAEELEFASIILTNSVQGDNRVWAETYAKLAQFLCLIMCNVQGANLRELPLKEIELIRRGIEKSKLNQIKKLALEAMNKNLFFCLIAGGETTAKVTGTGKGGRAQEMALQCAIHLDECFLQHSLLKKSFEVCFLACGTDGIDGPTDATGAVVDLNTYREAIKQGLKPEDYLANNDSYHFFQQFSAGQDHIKIGQTGTNVMDINVILLKTSLLDGCFQDDFQVHV